jgi:radical SAM protein with 4Fe4S-binding SPASM domain
MRFKPEVVFIYLDCTNFIYRGAGYHLGSGYVQAYLRQKGIRTHQLVADARVRLTGIVDMILQQRPRIVGFTCYDSNYYFSKLIAQLLKKQEPQIRVLMGGPSATFSDELIMRQTQAVDACIRGEGEITMGEVVERLLSPRPDLTGVEGVTHRQGDKVIREADRPRGCGPIKGAELDMFPSPFLTGTISPQEMTWPGVSTSRGCPYRCIYCNFAVMSGQRLRYHSLDRVTAELEAIEEAAEKRLPPGEKLEVDIHDDAFSLNIKRAKQLCHRLIAAGLAHLKLACETRVDHVDRELLELMRQAGFRRINFGLESAVPRVLRVIKKVAPAPATTKDLTAEKRFLQQTKQAVRWCQQVGIEPSVSIISGLPTETLEEGMATLEFVKKLGVKVYFHNHLTLHAGTELFEKQAAYGIRAVPSVQGLPYATKRHYDTRQIPTSDSRELCDAGNVIKMWRYFYHIQRLMTVSMRAVDFSCQDILLRQAAVIDSDLLHWLGGFIPPSAMLSVMNDGRKRLKWKRSMENIVQAGIPLLRFNSLVPGSQWTKDLPEYVWQQGVLSQKPYYQSHLHRFYFVPFSKLGRLADSKGNGDHRKRVIFLLLEDDQDRWNLLQLSKRVAQHGFSALPQELTSHHCSFINECCWRVDSCPAPGLSRLIINDEGDVSTCLFAAAAGKVGDKLEDIRQNLISLKQSQAKERGCQQCQVSNRCSKCLFPPMPAPEFCRLKRRHPSITNLVKIMPYLRSAWLHKTLPPVVYQTIFGNLGVDKKDKLELLTRLLDIRTGTSIGQPNLSSAASAVNLTSRGIKQGGIR